MQDKLSHLCSFYMVHHCTLTYNTIEQLTLAVAFSIPWYHGMEKDDMVWFIDD